MQSRTFLNTKDLWMDLRNSSFFRKGWINDLFNRFFLDIFVKNYGEVSSDIKLKFFPKFIRTAELTSPDLQIKSVLH